MDSKQPTDKWEKRAGSVTGRKMQLVHGPSYKKKILELVGSACSLTTGNRL